MTAPTTTNAISLQQLLAGEQLQPEIAKLTVRGLTLDSRAVSAGDLFIAVPGIAQDGRDYIEQALASGAVAVVAEASGLQSTAFPLVGVENLSHKISEIADRFFGEPSAALGVTAVTGTNGKTTCSQLLAQLFSLLDGATGVVGTLGYGVVTGGVPLMNHTGMTTPDAITTQQVLAELATQGVERVAIEVSSHSLEQGRVSAVQFDTAVFTNLSRDHLDYHGSLENYAAAKAKLFMVDGLRCAIVNIDDLMGREIVAELPEAVRGYGYSTVDKSADIHASDIRLSSQGISANIDSPWGAGAIHSHLLGEFNLANLLAVIGAACVAGFPLDDILAVIPQLKPIAGRMELVDESALPQVVVDYAHTPDALEQVLLALREHCDGQLWCVFGCGGDRDAGKRPQMGEISARLADRAVVTSDNPRSESPQAIVEEVCAGMASTAPTVLLDRAAAIGYAVSHAAPQDTVLIAGKGHEEYQLVGSSRLPFSDVKQARLALRQRISAGSGGGDDA